MLLFKPRSFLRPLTLALAASALLLACDDDGSGGNQDRDLVDATTGGDTSGEDTTAPDTSAPDATTEDTRGEDVTPDAEPDVTGVEQDVTDPDTIEDVVPDTADAVGTIDVADTTPQDTEPDIPVEACGDGQIDLAAGETCDIGIAPGQAGACPQTCPIADACQPRALTGEGCTVLCSDEAPIDSCVHDDGCCPAGCSAAADNDCVAPTYFRPDSLDVREPHLYATLIGNNCTDITDIANSLIGTSLTTDPAPSDGYLDLSFLLEFAPFSTTNTVPHNFAFGGGLCTAPIETSSCYEHPSFTLERTTYLAGPPSGQTTCLAPYAGTTSNYSPAPNEPAAPCFVSESLDIRIVFQGTIIPLSRARIAATFAQPNNDRLTDGLIVGFIDEATANTVSFPTDIPVLGGKTLASVLAGGAGSCQQNRDDRDVLPDGTRGWWFYLDFTADQVPFLGSWVP